MNATTAALADTRPTAETASYLKAVVIFILPFILTYVFTTIGNKNYQHGEGSREPPRVPYWIPYVGNTIGFAHNTENFLSSIL